MPASQTVAQGYGFASGASAAGFLRSQGLKV
jgi:hypothetical protein